MAAALAMPAIIRLTWLTGGAAEKSAQVRRLDDPDEPWSRRQQAPASGRHQRSQDAV